MREVSTVCSEKAGNRFRIGRLVSESIQHVRVAKRMVTRREQGLISNNDHKSSGDRGIELVDTRSHDFT